MSSSSICSNCGHDGLAKLIAGVPSSPVPELLTGHKPPSPSEAALAYTAIADIVSYLQRLEEEVANARSVLDDLERCRDASRKYLHAHEGILSSFRNLPPEILGLIFLESLPRLPRVEGGYASHETRSRSGQLYREAISNLGQVCKYWRDVSISTPQLWSSICLDGIRGVSIDKMDRWLQRSGETPLRLICPDYPNMLPLLLINTQRWEEAILSSEKLGWDQFTASAHHFPLLRTISIEVVNSFDGGHDFDDKREWSIAINAPLLHHLALRVIDPVAWIPSIQIPFSQLASLDLDFLVLCNHLQPVLDTLSHSRNISKCSLRFNSIQKQLYVPISSSSLINLPNLRYLDIRGDGLPAIIRHLVTPALRDFKCLSARNVWLLESFTSLITRSGCKIETLGMTFVGRASGNMDEVFMKLIQATPELKSLDVSEHSDELFSEPVMRALNRNISPLSCLAPRLKQLKLNVPDTLPEIELLVDLIVSRFDPESNEISPPGYSRVVDKLETVTLVQYQGPRTSATASGHSTRLRAGKRLASLEANGSRLIAKSSYHRDIGVVGIFFPDTSGSFAAFDWEEN